MGGTESYLDSNIKQMVRHLCSLSVTHCIASVYDLCPMDPYGGCAHSVAMLGSSHFPSPLQPPYRELFWGLTSQHEGSYRSFWFPDTPPPSPTPPHAVKVMLHFELSVTGEGLRGFHPKLFLFVVGQLLK